MDPTVLPVLTPTPSSPVAMAVTDRTVQILTLLLAFLSPIILALIGWAVARLGKIHTAVNSNWTALKEELAGAVKTIAAQGGRIEAQSGLIEALRGTLVGGRRVEDVPARPVAVAPAPPLAPVAVVAPAVPAPVGIVPPPDTSGIIPTAIAAAQAVVDAVESGTPVAPKIP